MLPQIYLPVFVRIAIQTAHGEGFYPLLPYNPPKSNLHIAEHGWPICQLNVYWLTSRPGWGRARQQSFTRNERSMEKSSKIKYGVEKHRQRSQLTLFIVFNSTSDIKETLSVGRLAVCDCPWIDFALTVLKHKTRIAEHTLNRKTYITSKLATN